MSESAALAAAVQAGRWAAAACQVVRSASGLEDGPAALDKADKSPVTVADFAAQALVCRALAEAFPDDPVVGEEDAAALRTTADWQGEKAGFVEQVTHAVNAALAQFKLPTATTAEILDWIDRGGADGAVGENGGRFWTVDPIDGTKGFLRGGQYAVAIALIENGIPTVGVLACPNLPVQSDGHNGDGADGGTGALFSAEKDGGATVRSLEPGSTPTSIHTSATADAAAARLCESVESAHTAHGAAAEIAAKLNLTADPLRLDSQAKYAEVARGGADIYLRLPTRPGYVERIWDHAAGVVVIEAAGGRVTDVDGQPLDFTHGRGLEKNRGVIATNGPLHDAVRAATGAVLNASN
ncbi:3'(2'),5'-bisphosphate nucleotidase [Alienimonas chondri]|uniref:3'(2'),5'-bisphosphate nucleotidase n=1 Tax=Alienimonas chondri TaxID=2681879 RepID=A0ABX1VGS9_9PLAN|nr:3'(2'),5'-bisphosphate nucleotidase [Alienimonas chondri]NNJ27328.1 3'(2'),5'-bisphosphate nucleotidase CysQ [Alienimonas chondri]